VSDPILIQRVGRVQTIRFNRIEKKNALTRDMYQAMADAVNAANDDDEIGASLFLGQPKVFTAGNDISDFVAIATGQADHSMEVVEFLKSIIAGTKPLVAGVDGFAIGVGCTMLMHCDLVYASDRAMLHTPFVDLGVIPEAGSSLVAAQIMGHQRAFALLAMGERFSAEQAHAAGLVNEVLSPERLEDRALEMATKLSERAPEAMAITRELIRGDRQPVLDRMEKEFGYFADRLQSDEAKAAFMKFMNKSKANA
jgi:enoyl-CoA hydratase/carnithine racemase